MDKLLNKPFRLPSGSGKKFGVYVKSKKTGKILKVTLNNIIYNSFREAEEKTGINRVKLSNIAKLNSDKNIKYVKIA